MQTLNQVLLDFMERLQATSISRLVIGLSGGMDSMVLLTLLVKTLPKNITLQALYVNHGLQVESDDWQTFCQQQCQRLNVDFQAVHVQVASGYRQGIESNARQQRYQALYDCVLSSDEPHSALVTAHHQRDQAETLLLNLGRGTGLMGLAAMPYLKKVRYRQQTLLHFRPLLPIAYGTLQNYAVAHQIAWIEDPSNQSVQYKRNRVRLKILPQFDQAWSNSQQNIAKTARNVAESIDLLNQLAEIDLQELSYNQFYLQLSELSWERQKNVFRFWAQNFAGLRLTETLLNWLNDSLRHLSSTRVPCLKLKQGELKIYDQKLFYLVNDKEAYDCLAVDFDPADRQFLHAQLIEKALLNTIADEWVRPLRLHDPVDHHLLKKWFKQNKIPVWDRRRWPVLLDANKEFIGILGLGLSGSMNDQS